MSTPIPVSIFILYAEEADSAPGKRNQDIREQLIKRLQEPGRHSFRVWTPSDEKPGDVLEEKRAQGLKNAKIVLLFVTDSFLISPQMQKESSDAFYARQSEGKIVIPVLLTDKDVSSHSFSGLIPIKPSLSEFDRHGSQAAEEIYRALVDVVDSRIAPSGKDASAGLPLTDGLQSISIWPPFAALALVTVIGLLIWFSRDPAGHNIKPPTSPSPVIFFGFSFVIGIAAMSLIQIARRLFRIRGAFHKARVLDWLGENATIQLYREVGVSRIKDLFDLPSELLTGQLAAIAENVIEQQSKNEMNSLLIVTMAATAERSEIASSEGNVEAQVNAIVAIQRNLDQFQISTSFHWRRCLMLSAILLSMTIFVIGLPFLQTASFMSGLADPVSTHFEWVKNFALLFAAALLTGLFAGFLGSIARDVVAIIEKLRR